MNRTATPRQPSAVRSIQVLWQADRAAAYAVAAWTVAVAVLPVLGALAVAHLVGAITSALSTSDTRLSGLGWPLALTAMSSTAALLEGPVSALLAGRVQTSVGTSLRTSALRAVSSGTGTTHLDDSDVVDQLARLDGRVNGVFPGNAPVTAAMIAATQASGLLACAFIARYELVIAAALAITWTGARWIVYSKIVEHSRTIAGTTAQMRRAAYFMYAASGSRDAKEVRLFGLSRYLADHYRFTQRRALDELAPAGRTMRARIVACAAFMAIVYGVALWFIVQDFRSGILDYQAFVTTLAMFAVAVSAGAISGDSISLQWMLAAWPTADFTTAERVELWDLPTLPQSGPVRVAPTQCAVRFDDVRFTYCAMPRPTLDGVSFALAPGSMTALVGVNGAGKSTLISLLCRFREPSDGRVTIDGVSGPNRSLTSWQRGIALVQQLPVRYPTSAYDNVAFGRIEHRDDHEGVAWAATAAGLDGLVQSLPHGWDTVLSPELSGGVDLSGGQWQKIALARALFAVRHGAQLLVLDEPTSALDAEAEAEFYHRFLAARGQTTTLIVSHRLGTVRTADNILVLRDGQICESGSHDDLLCVAGEYAAMFDAQAAHYGHTR